MKLKKTEEGEEESGRLGFNWAVIKERMDTRKFYKFLYMEEEKIKERK
jgi:hypothetical protein